MSRCRRNTSYDCRPTRPQLVLPVRRIGVRHLDLRHDPVQQQVEQLVLVRHVRVERGGPVPSSSATRRMLTPSRPSRVEQLHRRVDDHVAAQLHPRRRRLPRALPRRNGQIVGGDGNRVVPDHVEHVLANEHRSLDERRSSAVRCSSKRTAVRDARHSGGPDDRIGRSSRPAPPAATDHRRHGRRHAVPLALVAPCSSSSPPR